MAGACLQHPAHALHLPMTFTPSLQARAGHAGPASAPSPASCDAAAQPLRHGLEEEVQAMRGQASVALTATTRARRWGM